MWMVSFKVSPLDELLVEASEKPIMEPPSLTTAVSKLNRVRVEGSKNKVAITLPSSDLRLGAASKSAAESRIEIISSLL